MEQVSDTVYSYTEGKTKGNVASIVFPNFLIMVDSGMDPVTIGELRKELENRTNKKVHYLVITHGHADHILGNQTFSDCTILSSRETLKHMLYSLKHHWTKKDIENLKNRDKHFKETLQDLKITLPTKTFEGNYIIEDGNYRAEITQLGGHTKGSSVIWIEGDKVMIAGDILFAKCYPFGGDATTNIRKWIDAFDYIIKKAPSIIVPGHGPIVGIDEVKIQKQYFEELVKTLEDLIEKEQTLEDIKKSDSLPKYPYEVDERRFDGLIEKVYCLLKNET